MSCRSAPPCPSVPARKQILSLARSRVTRKRSPCCSQQTGDILPPLFQGVFAGDLQRPGLHEPVLILVVYTSPDRCGDSFGRWGVEQGAAALTDELRQNRDASGDGGKPARQSFQHRFREAL